MRSEFLYIFGYETPDEFAVNDIQQTDFESAGFFRILADSEEEALRWGDQMAEWYVRNLFDTKRPTSWKELGYSSWIEHSPDEGLRQAARVLRPVLAGHFPDFEHVRSMLGD